MEIVCTACLHRREKHIRLVWYDGVRSKSYFCIAKVEIDGLGMANVKDAIRFRREPCHHLQEEKSKVDYYAPNISVIRLEWRNLCSVDATGSLIPRPPFLSLKKAWEQD